MGKKIPYETAVKMAQSKKNDSIFVEGNPYGYRININHPQIKPFYEEYHRKIGVPLQIGLTKAQRLRFEAAIFEMIRRQDNVQQDHSDGSAGS